MLGGEGGKKKKKSEKAESCPGGLVAGDRWRREGPGPLRAPVPRSRRGRRPRGSAAPAPPNRIGFGEGKPAEERSRPAGKAETCSLPAAPAISRPSRLSPSLLPGEGCSLFFGEFHGPRRSGATRGVAGAAYLPLPEQPGQRGRGFPRHRGGLGPLSPAGSGETAAELRGTRYRLTEDGRFLGASPPVFTSDLGTRGRSAPSLSVGHPRHQVFPTPR